MSMLVCVLSFCMGLNSPQPLHTIQQLYGTADFAVEFIIYDLVFVRGEINSPFKALETYGFNPSQVDYTFGFGVRLGEYGEIGFKHTCSHRVLTPDETDYVPTWTGEQVYFKVRVAFTLIQ